LPRIDVPKNELNALNIIRLSSDLVATINLLKTSKKTLGFVPTMGALHSGHLSLVHAAKSQTDIVVCSIFVNPIQFNDPKDFEKYPKTELEDCKMLEAAGCNIVFIPTVNEVYPLGFKKEIFHFGSLENVMEGAHRPGHFSGVAMVVKRLFELVQPDKAFFGLKDYQQFSIIRELVNQTKMKIDLIGMPTVREEDGLAMSSRNRLLNENERKEAVTLIRLLNKTKENYSQFNISELKFDFENELSKHPDFKLDYFEIADGKSLQPLLDKNSEEPRAFVAAFLGNVRLIDNVALKQ
jgi:pantoate--beta-alanine ligase